MQDLQPALHNAFVHLCEKWEIFRYDKVTKLVYVDEHGNLIRVCYEHERVVPPTTSFRTFLVEEFLPKYKEHIMSQEITDEFLKDILDRANSLYRVNHCVRNEHRSYTLTNPREDNTHDDVNFIELPIRHTYYSPLRRVPAQLGLLEDTEYWKL